MPTARDTQALALHGGPKVRQAPWPRRQLFTVDEKAAAVAVFDACIEQGEAFGYGSEHETAYCAAFAESLGGGFADAVNSGTNAVYVALQALELEPFSEVVIPPITDPGGAMPVALLNLVPVVADAAPGTFNAGPDQIAAAVTERTSAIVLAHIAGTPVDMAPILELARGRSIAVIEDCAQAHGATYQGRAVGSFGDVAAFSTMHGKHHATGGQGGVVFARDEDAYWRIRRASDRGKPFNLPDAAGNVSASLNCNMDELHAAIGRAQLAKLPAIVAQRRKLVDALRAQLGTVRSVRVHPEPADARSSWWFVPMSVDLSAIDAELDTFVKALAAEGLPVSAGYVPPICDAPWFRDQRVFGTSGLPWSSPQYHGDRQPRYELPHARAVLASSFRLALHESCAEREVSDTIAAVRKVERAMVK